MGLSTNTNVLQPCLSRPNLHLDTLTPTNQQHPFSTPLRKTRWAAEPKVNPLTNEIGGGGGGGGEFEGTSRRVLKLEQNSRVTLPTREDSGGQALPAVSLSHSILSSPDVVQLEEHHTVCKWMQHRRIPTVSGRSIREY